MHIQKRAVNSNTSNGYIQKPSVPIEEKNYKRWRRFMNERAVDRAYVPTIHGIFSFFYYANFYLCIYRTYSKLSNTWLSNYSIIYCCSKFNISCKNARTILE